jgi:hypothetical protein
LNKFPRFQIEEEAEQGLFVDILPGKHLAHVLQNCGHCMLTIGETAEKSSGVVETETLVQVFGVQHRAPVSQRLEPYARGEGERGAPVRLFVRILHL